MTISEIRRHVSALSAGNESLDVFEDWLVQESWNVHKWEDIEAQRLVYGIELRLAEYSNGHLSKTDLIREFVKAADNIT